MAQTNIASTLQSSLVGFANFQFIRSGVELGIFEILDTAPSSSVREIQMRSKLPSFSLTVLLDGLVCIGLIRNKKGRYSNHPLANLFLRKNQKNLIGMLRAYHSILYPGLHALKESIEAGRNLGLNRFPGRGKTIYSRLASDPKLERDFYCWMKTLSDNFWESDSLGKKLTSLMRSRNEILDYAGGDGETIERLAELWPRKSYTLLDLPSTIRLAKKRKKLLAIGTKFISAKGTAPRVSGKYDVIILSNILSFNSPDENICLLRRLRRALSKNGVILILNTLTEGAGTMGSNCLSAYFLGIATGRSRIYSAKEAMQWLRAANLRRIKIFSSRYSTRKIISAR